MKPLPTSKREVTIQKPLRVVELTAEIPMSAILDMLREKHPEIGPDATICSIRGNDQERIHITWFCDPTDL